MRALGHHQSATVRSLNFREWEAGQLGLREKPLQMGSLTNTGVAKMPPSLLTDSVGLGPPSPTAINWS